MGGWVGPSEARMLTDMSSFLLAYRFNVTIVSWVHLTGERLSWICSLFFFLLFVSLFLIR